MIFYLYKEFEKAGNVALLFSLLKLFIFYKIFFFQLFYGHGVKNVKGFIFFSLLNIEILFAKGEILNLSYFLLFYILF